VKGLAGAVPYCELTLEVFVRRPFVQPLAERLKDEAIARQLGVSPHTVRRRIAALCTRLGVTTRFQAGLALGQQRAAEL
jgi:hypothetical protein